MKGSMESKTQETESVIRKRVDIFLTSRYPLAEIN